MTKRGHDAGGSLIKLLAQIVVMSIETSCVRLMSRAREFVAGANEV
jgi:hypothetical protein